MSRTKLPAAFIPPITVVAVAALIVLVALFVTREPRAVSSPIDLTPGAARTIEFRAAYSELYVIGIEMDQQVAKRLFPCIADASSSTWGHCDGTAFPLALSLALSANGTDVSQRIERTTSTAGGQYGGHETFTRDVAYVRLSRGEKYRLTVQPLIDGTALAPARPRLVVSVEPLVLKGEMVMRVLAICVATALGLIGAIWAAVVYVVRRVRAARA